MKAWTLFLCLFVLKLALADEAEEAWKRFNAEKQQREGVLLSAVPDTRRKQTFMNNWHFINEHNKQFKNKAVSYSLGIDDYADVPVEELIRMRNGRRANESVADDSPPLLLGGMKGAAPETFNWAEKGYVTPIKNQGKCGSCYTFSTAAFIESQIAIHFPNHPRLNLSSQQSVDCSGRFGNHGCNGGLETSVFRYVKRNGLEPLRWYPQYVGRQMACRHQRNRSKVTVKKIYRMKNVSVNDLKQMVATRGPLCVGMSASMRDFNAYRGGIYNNKRCPNRFNTLDHAVLLVGYGKANGVEYWIVKNSWGTRWGEKGFFRIAIDNDICGIRQDVSFADIQPLK